MGSYRFIASSTAVVLMINLMVSIYPGPVQAATGLNTTAIQDDTNVTANVNANQTDSSNVVDQSGTIVDVYTNPQFENRFLGGLFTLYLILLIAWLIDKLWLG